MEPQFMNTICPVIAKKKRQFLSAIEKEIEPIINSAKTQKKFDWTYLKRLYNNRKSELTDVYSLRIFCEFTFNLFHKFNCEDYELVIKIVLIYKLVMSVYSKFDICGYCRQFNTFPKHYLGEDMSNSRSILKQVNKLKVSDNCKFTNREFYGRLAAASVYIGDYAYLQFSVKYGLSYNPEDTLYQVTVQLHTLYSNYVSLNPQAGIYTHQKKETFANSVLKRLFENSLLENLRRINLIILAVDISLCKRVGDFFYLDYAKCYNLYASTLPEAPIAVKDVTDLLDFIFESDTAFKDDAISLFKEVFPEAPSFSSPRSLKYLCRCEVRYCMKKMPSLETVLSEIQIPNTVKDYLLYVSD